MTTLKERSPGWSLSCFCPGENLIVISSRHRAKSIPWEMYFDSAQYKLCASEGAEPVFLAGGLRADNVREAMEGVEPFGLDLCSGVRTHGKLDLAKLEAFFRAVKAEGSIQNRPIWLQKLPKWGIELQAAAHEIGRSNV